MECGHSVETLCHQAEATRQRIDSGLYDCLQPVSLHLVCGHSIVVSCKDRSNPVAIECRGKCGQRVSCGHVCTQTCSTVHGHRCDRPCHVGLVCGHECQAGCSAPHTSRCLKPCEVRCAHNKKCSRLCADTCIQCREPCHYGCAHQRCTRKCFEPCNRDPCQRR